MRNFLAVSVSVLSLSLLGPVACGGTASEQAPELKEQTQSLNATGTGCNADSDCASGLCWFERDSYPTYNPSWISADQCTEECGGPTDHASCQLLAADLNAPYPEKARCIAARGVYDDNPYDHSVYVCDFIPAGLGNINWVE